MKRAVLQVEGALPRYCRGPDLCQIYVCSVHANILSYYDGIASGYNSMDDAIDHMETRIASDAEKHNVSPRYDYAASEGQSLFVSILIGLGVFIFVCMLLFSG